ncbi:MAG: hypothetical protein ACE5G9_03670 [Nitrospinales bacterium]
MRPTRPFFLFAPRLFIGVVLAVFAASGATAAPLSCLERVSVLEKEKERVQKAGGLWAYFEKSSQLRDRSVQGLKLDGSINKVISNLKYLCETRNGVPLNDLALFVSQHVREKGEAQFKEEMRLSGKSDEEIDSWLKFSRSAQQNRKRTLDALSLQKTLSRAATYIEKYVLLHKGADAEDWPRTLLTGARELAVGIAGFLSTDPNMIIAIHENAQIPFWDTEENYGGS